MISKLAAAAKACLVLVLCAGFVSCKEESDLRLQTVVKVNGQTLSAGELADQLAARLRELHILSARDTVVVAQTKNSIIQDFVVRVVTEAWAHDHQIFVRQEDLAGEIAKTRKTYPDEIAFRKALADEGLSFEQWRDRVKFSALEQLVIKQITKDLKDPTEEELLQYYNEHKNAFERDAAVKLRQIVTETEHAAERILKELNTGKDFAELAKTFSVAPEASNGGLTDWIEKNTLKVFEPAFRMGIGQRSRIMKSPYGYHIYEVVARRNAKTIPFKEAREDIVKILRSEREQLAYSRWLEEQILQAKIFKNEALLSGISVHSRSRQ